MFHDQSMTFENAEHEVGMTWTIQLLYTGFKLKTLRILTILILVENTTVHSGIWTLYFEHFKEL